MRSVLAEGGQWNLRKYRGQSRQWAGHGKLHRTDNQDQALEGKSNFFKLNSYNAVVLCKKTLKILEKKIKSSSNVNVC